MATLNQNGIIFTLNADVVAPFSGKYTNDINYDGSTGLYNINQTKLNNAGVSKSVNAVEIDWNSAQVEENVTINSTGDLLNWIKTKGGNGEGTIPDPENPDEPTDSSPSVVRLTEDEFNQKLQNGELEEKILYIVVDANGKILFMYQIIDGVGHYTYMPEPQNTGVNSETLTIDEWTNKHNNNQINNNTIYIVTSNDGSMIIAIGNSGVLTNIPVPANGTVVRLTQEQYDAKRQNNEIDEGTLYLIVSITNGVEVVTKMYLGTVEVPVGSDATEAIVRSLITDMFSEKITWENDKVKSLNYSMIDVTNPGDFYAKTGFEDLVKGTVREAGFISKTDNKSAFAELFAENVSTDNTIAKKASIIASINESDETGVTINADKIDVSGIFNVKVGDTNKTASQLLVTANGLSSRVSNIEEDKGVIYASNINQNGNTIDLNIKYTDGNNQAQNASLTLGVDANSSSKIIITADQIKLNGETIANKITAAEARIGALEATTINANQIKSKIAESKYLALVTEKDNADDDIAALTSDGVFFAQGEIQTDENWAAWNTSLKNLFNKYSSIQKDGVYIYPSGKDNGYGAMIQSFTNANTTTSGLWLSDQNGTALMLPEQIILSSKTQTGLADWSTDLVSGDKEYVIISKNNISSRWKDSNYNVCSAYIGNGGIHIANNTRETGLYLYETGGLTAKGTNQELVINGGSLEIRNTATKKYLSIDSNGVRCSSLDEYIENYESEDYQKEVFKVTCSDPGVDSAFITDGKMMAIFNPTTMQRQGIISSNSIYGFSNVATNNLDIATDHHITSSDVDGLTLVITGAELLDLGTNAKTATIEISSNDELVYIYSNTDIIGNVTVSGTISDSSDSTLKDIVSDTTLTVEQIANAPAVNFTWKKDAYKENKKELVGTLAQYWQVVLPQVVGEDKDGKLNMQYGNAAMVSSIVTAKEVVELKSKVQDLEAENARLKLRLAKIEEKLGL